MDLSTSVRTDSLPAVATLVLPGLTAIAPWAALLLAQNEQVARYALSNQAIVTAAITLSSLLVGFVIESLGSYVEVYALDGVSSRAEERRVHWNAYLRLKAGPSAEAIGHRYLRRTLTSFKFELNMLVALFSVWFGIAVMGELRWFGGWTIEILLALSMVMWLFYRAARDSSDVLASVRALLLDNEPALVQSARLFLDWNAKPPGQ